MFFLLKKNINSVNISHFFLIRFIEDNTFISSALFLLRLSRRG